MYGALGVTKRTLWVQHMPCAFLIKQCLASGATKDPLGTVYTLCLPDKAMPRTDEGRQKGPLGTACSRGAQILQEWAIRCIMQWGFHCRRKAAMHANALLVGMARDENMLRELELETQASAAADTAREARQLAEQAQAETQLLRDGFEEIFKVRA